MPLSLSRIISGKWRRDRKSTTATGTPRRTPPARYKYVSIWTQAVADLCQRTIIRTPGSALTQRETWNESATVWTINELNKLLVLQAGLKTNNFNLQCLTAEVFKYLWTSFSFIIVPKTCGCVYFVLLQAGLRNIEAEAAPELHRAISGDLCSDDELDQATDEAVEE